MTLPESFLIALYCISGVMLLLAVLYIFLILFSKVLGKAGGEKEKGKADAKNEIKATPATAVNELSTGQLKLKDVDEPTAAMIMAIISDESGIPLSQLCFKSIKLLQKA